MADDKHTPGPWHAFFVNKEGPCAIVAEGRPGENLLGIYEDAENEGLAVFPHAPDGVLAAAAPDLADALDALLAEEGFLRPLCSGQQDLIDAAIAALRKAGLRETPAVVHREK